MCKYCEEDVVLLKGNVEILSGLAFFGSNSDLDKMYIKDVKQLLEEEVIQVFYDRGHLRLTIGEDIGCLDHSEDRIKVNYCSMCGGKIQ